MSSIIFYNPIVNDHITRNMLNPNAIKECSKSSNGHINNSVYNIDLLQWQLNTSNDSMNQFKSHSR
ncbi:unnamed protein product [Heterobilharzia americana]|nr:unnamed protein product [Heterobilharzia americana]